MLDFGDLMIEELVASLNRLHDEEEALMLLNEHARARELHLPRRYRPGHVLLNRVKSSAVGDLFERASLLDLGEPLSKHFDFCE